METPSHCVYRHSLGSFWTCPLDLPFSLMLGRGWGGGIQTKTASLRTILLNHQIIRISRLLDIEFKECCCTLASTYILYIPKWRWLCFASVQWIFFSVTVFSKSGSSNFLPVHMNTLLFCKVCTILGMQTIQLWLQMSGLQFSDTLLFGI
jgi:hypothetical protein